MSADRQKPQCYGNLFPNVNVLESNKTHRGEVFACRPNSFGMYTQSYEFSVDEPKWEHCTECPQYRTCYDLSMAKLLFRDAVLAR